MRLALVTNAPPESGMGKPARLLLNALRQHTNQKLAVDEYVIDADAHVVRRNDSVITRLRRWSKLKPVAWVRLGKTFRLHEYDVVHFTNQTLSFLVPSCTAATVVTVWDLIELTDPQERGGALAARVLYRGLPRAGHLVAVSQETAGALQRLFHTTPERMSVVAPAANPVFTFNANIWETARGREFLASQRVELNRPRILYVGSEHPRKNLPRLLEAVTLVRESVPAVEFVKIGGAGSTAGRAAFVATADRLRLWPSIRRIDVAHDDELVYWYHAARALAFPTLTEGFGFPPLEAMACGTPVITSNRSSLPEVVGAAAILIDPERVEEIAEALVRACTQQKLRDELRRNGLARAAQFTWAKTVSGTLAAYEKVMRNRSW